MTRPQHSTTRLQNAGEVSEAPVVRDALIPADLISDDEAIILLIRPSMLFIVLGSLASITIIIIISMMLAYLANRFATWVVWTDAQAFTLGAGLITLRLVWQTLEWYSRVYVLTDRRVIRRVGVLRVSIFECPLERLQHTSVFTQIRERLFGLGTIGFATAGSDTYDAFWQTVAKPFMVHRIVVETLNRYGGRKRVLK